MNVTGPIPTPPRAPAAVAPPASRTAPPAPAVRPAPAEATLWDLLSAEEREFFTHQAALGPITYRPDGAPRSGPAAPTGGRIDVRG
jgi:hypothetical protein